MYVAGRLPPSEGEGGGVGIDIHVDNQVVVITRLNSRLYLYPTSRVNHEVVAGY